jgi:hypothetical protein
MLVILATWEAEIRKIMVQTSLGKEKSFQTPSQWEKLDMVVHTSHPMIVIHLK